MDGRRRSASIRSTELSSPWASAPARLIEVVVLPSPTPGLEMAMTGTRRDAAPHELVGVMVFGVRDDLIVTGRFFIEPVDDSPVDADAAVRAAVAATR